MDGQQQSHIFTSLKAELMTVGEMLGFEHGVIRCFMPRRSTDVDSAQNAHTTTNCTIVDGVYVDRPGAYITSDGFISLVVINDLRLDITVDGAIKLTNYKYNCTSVISASGNSAAAIHPNGKVYQYNSLTEMIALNSEGMGNNKYAKIYEQGISFTSDYCDSAYMVESGGTRPVSDYFNDMKYDICSELFFRNSKHGPQYIKQAQDILEKSYSWISRIGTYNMIINEVLITLQMNGTVLIDRNLGDCSMRTSLTTGYIKLSTAFLHCTASLGTQSSLTVNSQDKQIYYDGVNFTVYNSGFSAGFIANEKLKIF